MASSGLGNAAPGVWTVLLQVCSASCRVPREGDPGPGGEERRSACRLGACSGPLRNCPVIVTGARRRNHLENPCLYEQLTQINAFCNQMEFPRLPAGFWGSARLLRLRRSLFTNLTPTTGSFLGSFWCWGGARWAAAGAIPGDSGPNGVDGDVCEQAGWDADDTGEGPLRATRSAACRRRSDASPGL